MSFPQSDVFRTLFLQALIRTTPDFRVPLHLPVIQKTGFLEAGITHTHTYIHTRGCTCTHTYTHMHTHKHTYTSTHTHAHMHIQCTHNTHTQAHIHTHTHAHTGKNGKRVHIKQQSFHSSGIVLVCVSCFLFFPTFICSSFQKWRTDGRSQCSLTTWVLGTKLRLAACASPDEPITGSSVK